MGGLGVLPQAVWGRGRLLGLEKRNLDKLPDFTVSSGPENVYLGNCV